MATLNRCVTAILIDTSKLLDVEPMPKYCIKWEANKKNAKNSLELKLWEEKHKSVR